MAIKLAFQTLPIRDRVVLLEALSSEPLPIRRERDRLIREAIQLHVEDMRERGYPIPKPTAASELVELQSV